MENNDKNHFGKVMHIDTSGRFYQKGNTGIAFKKIDDNSHKGMCLSNKLKRELDKAFNARQDYPRNYAICIYYLVKDSLKDFDTLIICNDECFLEVKLYLEQLFADNKEYFRKRILGLSKFREITGDNKIRTYADRIAKVYGKKALLSIQRRQKGIVLNIIEINYSKIAKKWIEIDDLLKKR